MNLNLVNFNINLNMNLNAFSQIVHSGSPELDVELVDRSHRHLGTVSYAYLRALSDEELALFYQRMKTHAQHLERIE